MCSCLTFTSDICGLGVGGNGGEVTEELVRLKEGSSC